MDRTDTQVIIGVVGVAALLLLFTGKGKESEPKKVLL
jgi:hypothetical protein